MKCDICSNENLVKFLKLGLHPPPLNFLTNENDKEEKFPLEVYFCKSCGLVQLGNDVDPNIMFKEYLYTSGVSIAFKKHLELFAKMLIERFKLTSSELVIDIASNDGTLLSFFSAQSIQVLGVEPSTTAKIAEENGIPTINEFFDESVAGTVLEKYGKAKVITATNIFAHVTKLDSFIKGVKKLLTEDGIFVIESQYLLDIVKKLAYDTIYHEHLRYYGLKQLIQLFNAYELEVFDAERIDAQGGSFRVFTAKKGKFKILNSVNKMLKDEEENKLSALETFLKFAERVKENKRKIRELLLKLKSDNKKIVGLSAPARSCTLLNYWEINSELVDYIVEKSTLKIGKFTPGTHIKVLDDKKLIEEQPDYALLLSWHFGENIINKFRNDGYKGKIIIPLPEPIIL